MNCQDVSLILDDRNAAALGATEQRDVDAHLAICADCTRDWQIHAQLTAALVPSVPVELSGRIRSMLAAPASAAGGWRLPGRWLLMGGLFAAGAAAALLVDKLVAPKLAATSVVVTAPTAQPAPVTSTATAAATAQTGMPPGTTLSRPWIAQDRSGSGPAASAARPIRVQVMPLLNQATGDAVAAVDAEFAAFLDGLRAVPGVTLVTPDSAASSAQPADYRLTVRGVGPMIEGKFRINLATEVRESSGTYRSLAGIATYGDIDASCERTAATGAGGICSGPQRIAALQLMLLNTSVFTTTSALASTPALQRDPADMRRSILGSSSSPDARGRASAWRSARGLGAPEFLQPLLNALRTDGDATVRAWAAGTLAADFSEDPRVRAALDAAAANDAKPMVRAFVQRVTGNKAAWQAYIVESLHDTTLSTAERMEAICLELEQPTESQAWIEALLASSEVIEPLTSLLGGMETWPQDNRIVMVMSRVGRVQHPAVINMLVQNLGRYQQLTMAGINVVYLLSRHAGDPRVRAGLEKISRNDPDPNVRQNAADVLKRTAAAAAQSPTP